MPTAHRALIWSRHDFRESSRLVTLLTRESGKLSALAKGAHRLNSPMLGKIDLLNLVDATVSGRPGNLKLLSRLTLLHEHRELREPRRFLAASYLIELFDPAFPQGRQDPELFDLIEGAIRLIDKCPLPSIPTILAGIELRFLRTLGLLPGLPGCRECGEDGPAMFMPKSGAGFLCPKHATGGEGSVREPISRWLARVDATPGKDWARLQSSGVAEESLTVLGNWIARAVEKQPRLRRLAIG